MSRVTFLSERLDYCPCRDNGKTELGHHYDNCPFYETQYITVQIVTNGKISPQMVMNALCEKYPAYSFHIKELVPPPP